MKSPIEKLISRLVKAASVKKNKKKTVRKVKTNIPKKCNCGCGGK